MAERTPLGEQLIKSLDQVLAYRRGELAVRTRIYRQDGGDWSLIADGMMTGPEAREIRHKAGDTPVAPPPAYAGAQVRAMRARLGLSQRVFAAALNVSPGTVQAWEQGRRVPDGPSRRLLELIERHPDIFLAAVRPAADVA